jgi:hypothetical protein
MQDLQTALVTVSFITATWYLLLINFVRSKWGATVTVTVGSELHKREWSIYEGLLTHYTSYFRTALQNKWKEGETGVVDLPHDNPDVFQAVFEWLYTGKLYPELTEEGRIPLDFETICGIYVFGDIRGIPGLCNASINLLFQTIVQAWDRPDEVLNYVYDNTCAGSNLRKFLVDQCIIGYGDWSCLSKEPHLYPCAFLSEVIQASAIQAKVIKNGIVGSSAVAFGVGCQKPRYIEAFAKNMCCYHDHSDYPEDS